jgi:hypothetical protein
MWPLFRCAPEGARSRSGHGPRAFGRALAILIAIVAAPANAAPRGIDDCEAIKDANAYNLCLASFGPVRGQHGANYPGVASEGEKRGGVPRKGNAVHKNAHAGPRLGGVSRSPGGRVRMEFTPGRR